MKKIIMGLIIFTVMLFSFNLYAAVVIAWNSYTDSSATGLKIESSTNQINWNVLIPNISTDTVAYILPDQSNLNQRVYYRLKAFNSTNVSDPSNVISYYWGETGSGTSLQTPGGFGFVDCSNPKDNSEEQICNDLGL